MKGKARGRPIQIVSLSWSLFVIGLAAGALLALLALRVRGRKPAPLPEQWPLAPRPVFSGTERQLLQRLREALPQHVVLVKLPLVRLCQPMESGRLKRWFDLIGSTYVTFAVCTPGGRVVLALDLDHGRPHSRRADAIKTAVLDACRIAYVRVPQDGMPSTLEIRQMLADPAGAPGLPAAHPLERASATLAHTVRAKRAARSAGGPDSAFAQDSFFAPENAGESSTGFGSTVFGAGEPTEDAVATGNSELATGLDEAGRRHP